MNLNWFTSRKVRRATEMRRHVLKFLNHQRDLLSSEAIQEIEKAMKAVDEAVKNNEDNDTIEKVMGELETVANEKLKPYPNAGIRENIEVFLVAIAVAVGIRTFFLQPFKIPTGSMQPTLYGITPPPPPVGPGYEADLEVPNRIVRLFDFWFHGISYFHETAEVSGRIEEIRKPVRFLLFNLKQQYRLGGKWHTIWFPDDTLFIRAGLYNRIGSISRKTFEAGEDVIKLRVKSGDHLFVDRLSFNFRAPERGDIIVFATKGTQIPHQDQFYIKRLIAKGGEHVSIGDDNHVVVDGVRLDASTPHFENVYTFDPENPEEGKYFGHVNDRAAISYIGRGIAPKFQDADDVFVVPDNSYIAFGDNTLNSSDSRDWGSLPRENVIGKSFFVYWPISKRFGWGNR